MRRTVGAVAALIVGSCPAQALSKHGYIAVPGGYSCPRDCDLLGNERQCAEAAVSLGLPRRNLTRTSDRGGVGGCSWAKEVGLRWNSYTDRGLRDVEPHMQVVGGKLAVAGGGAAEFRICQCSRLPRYVSVVHAACAPNCPINHDPCRQHPTCRRITQWESCTRAAQGLDWVPADGPATSSPARTAREVLSEWNANFEPARWRKLTGAGNATPANPLWREWSSAEGLIGGRDRMADLLSGSPHLDGVVQNVLWRDAASRTWMPLPPPPLNFLGYPDEGLVPRPPYWSEGWQAPPAFVEGRVDVPQGRPEGCTFDSREERSEVLDPWGALRLRLSQHTAGGASVAPCVGGCGQHQPFVENVFEMCECGERAAVDECSFFAAPCGVGQTCVDTDVTNEPDPSDPQFMCTCDATGETRRGGPADCTPHVWYTAVAGGRTCSGGCAPVTTPQGCSEAALRLRLPTTEPQVDDVSRRRTRPCGCHYASGTGQCGGAGCLRFNPAYGDEIRDGCDAYAEATPHDVVICQCSAEPAVTLEPSGRCLPTYRHISSSTECRASAAKVGMAAEVAGDGGRCWVRRADSAGRLTELAMSELGDMAVCAKSTQARLRGAA